MVKAKWWRFSKYEFIGTHICPAPGAKPELYDPWQSYRPGWSRRKGEAPPYQDALALARRVNIRPSSLYSAEGSTAVALLLLEIDELKPPLLQWCAKYGLPGTLLQSASSLELAPRWEPHGESTDVLVPTRTSYFLGNSGWSSLTKQEKPSRIHLSVPLEQRGKLVDQEFIPRQWGRPHVAIQQIGKPEHEIQQLVTTWSRFFPNVPKDESETYHYPIPTSAEFWIQYSEPLDALLGGLGNLEVALEKLTALNTQKEADSEKRIGKGLDILNSLVATTNPVLTALPEGRLEKRWQSPSLLAMLAMMILLDLEAGHRVLKCDVCRTLFVSRAYQARYCSTTCNNTSQVRAYRQRAKRQKQTEEEYRQEVPEKKPRKATKKLDTASKAKKKGGDKNQILPRRKGSKQGG